MMSIGKDDCIILGKCIHDLVKKTTKKAVEILKKVSFIKGNVDPCLYMKKSAKQVDYVVMYVDDNLMIRSSDATDQAEHQFKSSIFVLKVLRVFMIICCIKSYSNQETRKKVGKQVTKG